MEIALLTFSAISAISTVVIAVLLFQIQKSLNTNKIQQEKLLRLVEANNELNKQIGQMTTEGNRKQTEYSETFEHHFDNLIQRIEIFDNYLNELLQGNNKSSDRLYNLLYGNTNIQLEKLQAALDELKALKASLEESVRF